MGLDFGCEKCWETPCICGWQYKGYTTEEMSEFIRDILQYRTKEEAIEILRIADAKVNDPLQKWCEK